MAAALMEESMKLSEMSTGEMADVLVQIAEPVANIAADPKITAALDGYSKAQKSGKTVAETFGKMIGKLAPALLQTRRNDVYVILSVLTGKTIAEIDAQKFTQTVSDVKACWDSELLDFFKSAADSEQAEPSQPSQPADQ